MKAGVSFYCFNKMLVDGAISVAAVIEFVGRDTEAECIEPLSRYWDEGRDTNEQAREAKALCDEVGLAVSCYTLDSDFAVYDEAKHRECIATSIARLETAQILGTDTIRLDPRTSLPPEARDEPDLDEIIARMASGMAAVADAAAERGMTVGVDNHGRLVGRCAQIAKMVELAARPNFGVNLDPTNFRNVFGEDHVEATRRLAPRVVHVHAKDFRIRREPREGDDWREIPTGEWVKRAVGGSGDAQWPQMLAILKAAGYDGTISLEISLPDDIQGSVAQGVANLRRLIASLA